MKSNVRSISALALVLALGACSDALPTEPTVFAAEAASVASESSSSGYLTTSGKSQSVGTASSELPSGGEASTQESGYLTTSGRTSSTSTQDSGYLTTSGRSTTASTQESGYLTTSGRSSTASTQESGYLTTSGRTSSVDADLSITSEEKPCRSGYQRCPVLGCCRIREQL